MSRRSCSCAPRPGVPARRIGTTGRSRLRSRSAAGRPSTVAVAEAERIWATALEQHFARAGGVDMGDHDARAASDERAERRKRRGTCDKFKDECGVFGIFGHPEAANLTYLGLYALQHRGQESAGIVAADGEKMRISRAMGHVADAFDEARSSRCPATSPSGTRATRPPARASCSNAQPILIDCAHGQIAIAHNGNLVNAARAARRARPRRLDLPDEQRHRGRAAPLRAVARASVEDALIESISQIRGAFSLALLTKDRLIAARDPHGFRPLALGKLGDA